MNIIPLLLRSLVVVAVVFHASCLSSCTAAPAAVAVGARQQFTLVKNLAPTPEITGSNAVWLGHAFVTTDSVIARVPEVCAFMRDHKVAYWFVNLGLHDKSGQLSRGAVAVPRAAQFLNAVGAWETANNHHFKVLGWLNGSMDTASARFIDLSQPPVRRAMLDECRRFSDPKSEGSYVSGAARPFDGIQYDLEPSGADQTRFANLLTFMKELRATLGPNRLTSFTPHKMGDKGRYWWSAEFFYRMAPEVDLLGVMAYDALIKDEASYREWMKNQTVGVLQAVSGAQWANDAAHPAPRKAAKIFIGFPAFPANKSHEITAETMMGAIQGTQDGLRELEASKDASLQFFGGAAVYLYTDGTGKDGYSSPADWGAFQNQWLGATQPTSQTSTP